MIDYPDDDYEYDYDDEESDGSRLRERLESLLPNVIRRTVSTGVGAKQYTEDVIKNALQDRMMPKELVTYIVDLADNTKGEIVRVAAREFRQFLDSAKFNQELAKVLTTLSFEIRTEIRFIPNDQAVKPSVETSARVKSSGKPIDAAPGATEKINEAVRASATELSEMVLGRLFRAVADDMDAQAGDEPAAEPSKVPEEAQVEAEAEAEEPAPEEPKPKRRRRASKKKASDS